MSEHATLQNGSWSERFAGAALVTGASSGIGEAFAWALAARGMDLFLVALDHEGLVKLAAAIEAKHGVRTALLATDLGRPDSAEVVHDAVEAAGMSIGLLVNSAGYGLFGPFIEQNPADQAAMIDVNCRAPASLARIFAPSMKERGCGGMIFVASTAAYQPTPYMATYAATKVFDLFLAEALWAELGEYGVEVLGLSPGHVRTAFQARCGDPIRNPPGGISTPEEIVSTALSALGRKPSVIPGIRNVAMAVLTRLLPRSSVMTSAIRYFNGLDHARPKSEDRPPPRPKQRASTDSRFVRSVMRLLVAFLSVAVIDVVVCSLITHKLRFWFPLWLDPNWDTSPDSWVIYSQSYAAGILFLPVLALAALREFVPKTARVARTTFIAGTLALLAFIAWWKGGLMLQYNKGQEALAWIALTAITWALIRIGEELPALSAQISPRQLATRLAQVLAVFFLVMAVADPVVTVGVQGLPWSSGLFIEMGFFVPAGIALWVLTSRRRPEPAPSRRPVSISLDQSSNQPTAESVNQG